MLRTMNVSTSLTLSGSRIADITGVTVTLAITATSRGWAQGRDIGPKIWASTPCMVKSGRNAAMVMITEKNIGLSTWTAATRMRCNLSEARDLSDIAHT